MYGCTFALKALGGGLLVFDDHPGQLYRIWHALTVGLAPWRLDTGWWAGYAELQFYPPGFSYAGAALHWASLGALDLSATYQALLWVTFLLPGASTYVLLLRVLKSPWLALPGAFLALTLSAGSRSGVEEGMRWGLVAARLGWGVLPLLALALHRASERGAPAMGAPPLLAAIILIHPAHAPAGFALVLLAAWRGPGSRLVRGCRATLLAGAAAALAAFWLVPLLAHLGMALPLAWGEPSLASLARAIGLQPLVLCLVAASLVSWMSPPTESAGSTARWLADLAPALAGIIAVDALVAQPLGIVWLPADRLLDSFFLALILGASLAVATLHRRLPALPSWGLAIASIAFCALLSGGSRAEPTLSLWPRSWPNAWPKYEAVARGVRLPELWEALRQAPAGRILFLRSGVPVEYRPDWRRPHSHLTALTPLWTGREILNGTFTHPSPIAGLVYTGSPANRPITLLVEQRDGVTLFGQPLADLGVERFNDLADRLRVSAVVALDEDQGHIDFVARNPAFTGPARIGPFLLFASREPRPLPAPAGDQIWRVNLPTHDAGWVSTGMAYGPLWRVRADRRPLLTRRDPLGLLEVHTPPGANAIELEYRPGAAEWTGLLVSAAAVVALIVRRRRRGASLTPADRS